KFSLCIADRVSHPKQDYVFEVDSIHFMVRSIHDFNWNGYVILPPDHSDCGKNIDRLRSLYQVHNGLSFCRDDMIGFSGCDYTDYCYTRDGSRGDKPYRTFEFIKAETASLARQV